METGKTRTRVAMAMDGQCYQPQEVSMFTFLCIKRLVEYTARRCAINQYKVIVVIHSS